MKTLNGTFEVKDLEQLIINCEFDNEDATEIRERAEKNIPLIQATNHLGNAQSIYLTFSEADHDYCILSNTSDEELVNSVINDIMPLLSEL